jgi:methionyl-tRNA formyltransferase
MNKIRIILFFNNYRGLEIFKFLRKKKIDIRYIFLSKKFINNKVVNYLKNKEIKFSIIDNLNKKIIYNKIKKLSDLNIICGFPYIFNKELINLNKYGTINCHAGKLPNYRGGSPLQWQMINGEKKIGLSVIKINEGIDTGDIVKSITFLNKEKYTINDLHSIANKKFPLLVYESIQNLINKKKLKKQSVKNKMYYRQRNESDSLLNFKKYTFKKNILFIKALQDPYPNAFFYIFNQKIKIKKITLSKQKLYPGEIRILKNIIYIGCKDKSAKIIKYNINI